MIVELVIAQLWHGEAMTTEEEAGSNGDWQPLLFEFTLAQL